MVCKMYDCSAESETALKDLLIFPKNYPHEEPSILKKKTHHISNKKQKRNEKKIKNTIKCWYRETASIF